MNENALVMTHIGVGIDTARYGHVLNFLDEHRQRVAPQLTVTENSEGYQKLEEQLNKLSSKYPHVHFHVHIDAAGQYAANLERFLRSLDMPMTLSVGEPKRNKDYHRAFFPKSKADATESQAMARFGVVERPLQTPEVPNEFFALGEIVSRLQGQIRDTTRTANRLHNVLARVFPELATLVSNFTAAWLIALLKQYPTPARIAAARLSSLEKIPYLKAELAEQIQTAARKTIGSLTGEVAEMLIGECVEQLDYCRKGEKRLEKLLLRTYQSLPPSGHMHVTSIAGIGQLTAAVLVAKMISIERFETPEKLVGYFGIFPEENTSGVDRQGNKVPPGTMHMSRKGSDVVRRYLWNAAKSAIQHNAAVRDLYRRLRSKGTRGDVALGHCMRKLLHQVFGVWASNTPFDQKRALSRHILAPQVPPSGSSCVQPPIETAAGHKRDVLPDTKVVTAATSSVTPSSRSVNSPTRTNATGAIDFAHLREQITIERLLSHLGYFRQLRGSGEERRGPCPLHGDATGKGKRDFAVNLRKNVFHCVYPKCGRGGNALDFWAAVHDLPLYEAAVHMADTFNLQLHPGTEKRSP